MAKYLVLAAVLLGTAACGDTWGQRAVTGGGIGAGSGALIGALTPLGVCPVSCGGAVGACRRGTTRSADGDLHDEVSALGALSLGLRRAVTPGASAPSPAAASAPDRAP